MNIYFTTFIHAVVYYAENMYLICLCIPVYIYILMIYVLVYERML